MKQERLSVHDRQSVAPIKQSADQSNELKLRKVLYGRGSVDRIRPVWKTIFSRLAHSAKRRQRVTP